MTKPLFPIRIVMQVLSAIVCLALIVALLGTTLLLDLKLMTTSGGLQTIISAVFSGNNTAATEPQAAVNGGHIVRLGETDIQIPDSPTLSTDMLTDASLLTDYLYDIVKESFGEDVTVTKEQVQSFIDESTVSDFTSEKAASYISDAITGEETTTITTDELMQLFEENEDLIEKHFNVTVDDETKQSIRTQVDRVVEEEDLNGTIRQQIDQALEQPIEGTEYTVKDIMRMIGQLTAGKVIWSAVGLCLVLMLLLMLLNFYRLPKGLSWIGSAMLSAGLPLAIIAAVLQATPELAARLIPQLDGLNESIQALVGIVAPLHYALPALGIVMIALSVVWRILAKMYRVGRFLTGADRRARRRAKRQAKERKEAKKAAKLEKKASRQSE